MGVVVSTKGYKRVRKVQKTIDYLTTPGYKKVIKIGRRAFDETWVEKTAEKLGLGRRTFIEKVKRGSIKIRGKVGR